MRRFVKSVFWTGGLIGWGVVASNLLFWLHPGAFLGLGIFWAAERAAAVNAVASSQPPPSMSPADLSAVLLAVATIVLAVVAFGISVGAFFGYGEIKSFVRNLAEQDRTKLRDELTKFRSEVQGSVLEFEDKSRAEIGQALNNAVEELNQASGLGGGDDADAIARASGETDSRSI